MNPSSPRTHPPPSPARQSVLMQWLKLAPGYALAITGLLWVLHDFHFSALRAQLLHLKWEFVAPALLCDVMAFFCQGWRWQLLLRTFGKISLVRTTQALLAGLFISEVTPMSLGELARSYLAARWMGARFATIFPTVLIERLFDGVWMAIGLGLTALFVPLPEDLIVVRNVLSALVLIGTGALLFFILRQSRRLKAVPPPEVPEPAAPPRSFIAQLGAGLIRIGFRRDFYLSFGASLCFLLLQALTFWLMLRGYGLRLSFWAGTAVLIIVMIGTALPGPPGNVGTYQFSCVVGLALFGVSKTLATGFSIVVFSVLTIPLVTLGFFALSRSGTTLFHLRREIRGLTAQ